MRGVKKGISDRAGMALLPSKKNPKVKRWVRVVDKVTSAKNKTKEALSSLGAKARDSLPKTLTKHLKGHGAELKDALKASPLSSSKKFEKAQVEKLKYLGVSELRNHRNMLKLVGFAVASAIPPVGAKLSALREEQLGKHKMSREEAAVAGGYLAQYAYSFLPKVGYTAIVKGGLKAGLFAAGLPVSGPIVAALGTGLGLAVGSLLVWRGISEAIKHDFSESLDRQVFEHLEGVEKLVNDERLNQLSTMTGKSLGLSAMLDKSLSEPSGLLDEHDRARLGYHMAQVMQPLLESAFDNLSQMFESGDIPNDVMRELGDLVSQYAGKKMDVH